MDASRNTIKYEGPVKLKNKTFIKTIRDGLNGSKVFVDSKGNRAYQNPDGTYEEIK